MEEEKTTEEPQGQLEKAAKERDEYLAGWQRSRADLMNYKKEEMERIGSLMRYAQEELLLKLLPVLDNLERAEKQASQQDKESSTVQGCFLVISQLKEFLRNQGVEALHTEGEKFNPELHEAVGEEAAEGKEPGTVLEEVERGYLLLGKLLRPAKVKIAK
ncbi:MAG: nucleotide exchange factor GrpE [Parcubacteria group bacterium]|nr:nucleotide exchange factor GrpE [Parcubacteria group bacterium]